jgi:hypothetical protein
MLVFYQFYTKNTAFKMYVLLASLHVYVKLADLKRRRMEDSERCGAICVRVGLLLDRGVMR